ncbi:serine hydrolase domain-containing protein [Aquimarina spongiae]|nr:serine hydrolase domain-containing protein [Aquimarina spongiae]
MKLILNLFFCLFLLNLFGQQTNKIDKTINSFMNKWEIEGLSIAIINAGDLVYTKGYGYSNITTKEKVTPKHKFRIGSISKSITAVTIFTLMEEGKLSLSDKVFGKNGILNDSPYLKILDQRILEINVQQLLEHTAGWGKNKSFDPMFKNQLVSDSLHLGRSPTPKDVIIYMLQNHYLDNAPGSKFMYSNLGYCILGRVIEKLTGLDYENAVKKQVLSPLKMFDTKIGDSKNSGKNESVYYSEDSYISSSAFYPFQEKVKPEYGGFDLSLLDSCGGWTSSVIVLAKLICALDGYTNRKDIVLPQSLNTMFAASLENSNYAKGWFVDTHKNWWHNGSLIGSYGMMAKINDGRGWVILMNNNIWNNKKFYKDVDKLLFKPTKKLAFSKLINNFTNY